MNAKMHRSAFLSAVAAFTALPALAAAPSAFQSARRRRALVLSGGGARGAYQAGLVDYLAQAAGVADGAVLPPYGFVAGTSIGALNGYFVATGQYGALRNLWYRIADQRAIVLKPRFAHLAPENDAGVLTKVGTALRLALGLGTNVKGVLDGEHLRDFLAKVIDPERPVLVPFVFTTTNLTRQAPEFFYRIPTGNAALREAAIAAVRHTAGPSALVREATPDILIDALRASAAIPIAFDPVKLKREDSDDYDECVDGGVTANTPIVVARAAAATLDVVLMDPVEETFAYKNAVDIGLGVFGTMQTRIFDADLRSAYMESAGKAALQNSGTGGDFGAALLDVQMNVLRPKRELEVSVIGFDERENLWKTYKRGFADAAAGFTPYVYGA